MSRSTPSCCPQTEICSQGPSGPRTSTPPYKASNYLPHLGYQTQEQPKTCPNHVLSEERRWLHPGDDQGPIWLLLPSRLARCSESCRRRIETQASATQLRMWVSFECTGFSGLCKSSVRICKADFLRRSGCSRASIAPAKSCPHRFWSRRFAHW